MLSQAEPSDLKPGVQVFDQRREAIEGIMSVYRIRFPSENARRRTATSGSWRDWQGRPVRGPVRFKCRLQYQITFLFGMHRGEFCVCSDNVERADRAGLAKA